MIIKRRLPFDYGLCNQTVTVYHRDGDRYTRNVIEKGAFLECKKTQNVEKTGSKETNSFLLVIPGNSQQVFIGDKVMHGIGPECATRKDWAALIPVNVPGLVVVDTVDPQYWNDELVHTEASG